MLERSADSRLPQLVLLDRDGTINRKAADGDYIRRSEDLHLLPGAAEAVARVNALGIPVALVTNQRGVARGLMSLRDVEAVHDRLAELLASSGAHLDAIFLCPHEHGTCDCRKPQPGLVLDALRRFGVAAGQAIMVGDAGSDVEAGRRARVRTLQIGAGDGTASAADLHAPTLADAVDLLLS